MPLEIVRRAVAGDAVAADELVTLAYPEIVRWARATGHGNPEDVAQEAALVVHRKIVRLDGPENLGRFIYGVVRMQARQRDRPGQRLVAVEDVGVRDRCPAPLADQVVEARADLDVLRATIEACDDNTRRIVELHFGEDMKPQRIAFKLRLPPVEVVETLAQFRLTLAARLAEDEEGPMGVPTGKSYPQLGIDWDNEPRLGKMPDARLAELRGCSATVVASARKRRKIPAYVPTAEEKRQMAEQAAKARAEKRGGGKVVPIRQDEPAPARATTQRAALPPARPEPARASRSVEEASVTPPPPAAGGVAASPWDLVVAGLEQAVAGLQEERARIDVQLAEAHAMLDTARGKADRWRPGAPR